MQSLHTQLKYCLNPSGGIGYHTRAWRYRRSLWKPFQHQLVQWLMNWPVNSKQCILIGPSGGYNLPLSFLKQFDDIICVEPDPLARQIFRKRFPQLRLQMIVDDNLLTLKDNALKLSVLLERYPTAAILFCNMLGQLPWIQHAEIELQFALLDLLQHRTWASFHDVLSVENLVPRVSTAQFDHPLSLEIIAKTFFTNTKPIEVYDHNTLWLSRHEPLICSVWELTAKQVQIIGWVNNS